MLNIKKHYRLIYVEGYECEGERLDTVACRYCSNEEIEREVKKLNENYPDFKLEAGNSDWRYYDYEELFFSEEGEFNNGICLRSLNYELNKKSLINMLTSKFYSFDERFNHHYNRKSHYFEYDPNFDLQDRILTDFDQFVIGNFTRENLIETIKDLKEQGKIQADLSLIGL